jgi:hypothetical protein
MEYMFQKSFGDGLLPASRKPGQILDLVLERDCPRDQAWKNLVYRCVPSEFENLIGED